MYRILDDGTVVGEDGNPILDTNGQPVKVEAKNDDVDAKINKARSEVKDQYKGQIEREKEQRKQLQAQYDDLQKQITDIERAKMKPDERLQAQLQDLTNQLETQRTEFDAKLRQESDLRKASELVAYKERVLRSYNGTVDASSVFGSTEAEIDASAATAARLYAEQEARIRADVEAKIRAEYAAQQPQTVQQTPATNGGQTVVPAQMVHANPSFPTVVNPPPVPQQAPTPVDLKTLTSEEAVRSGRYSGELRKQIHAQLRMQGSQPQLDTTSYATVPAQAVQMPGGIQQPQGHATPVQAPPQGQPVQAMPPQQQPVAPATAPTPQQTAVQAAQAAIDRTHSGQNPVMGQNPDAANVLRTVQPQIAQNVDPASAHAARFAPTPPVAPQQ